MLYLLAMLAPFLAVMLRGKILTGIFLLILQCTVVGWIPAVVVAWIIIGTAGKSASTSGAAPKENTGGSTVALMMLRYFIPAIGNKAKAQYEANLLDVAKEEDLSPDVVLTFVSGGVLIDEKQNRFLCMNHDFYWTSGDGCPPYERHPNVHRIDVYVGENDAEAYAYTGKKEEVDALQRAFRAMHKRQRAHEGAASRNAATV